LLGGIACQADTLRLGFEFELVQFFELLVEERNLADVRPIDKESPLATPHYLEDWAQGHTFSGFALP